MLVIRTGLMGNGKTINTIKEVDAKACAENRPVYYHNVTGLKPEKLKASWFEFEDPHKWFELPQDAIIVVDEAQGWFGVRDPRKEVPLHLSRFEIMRKSGHEVHLITQDPRFLDVHARRLCNAHIHYWRIFGTNKVSRYELPRIKDDVEKFSQDRDASRQIITLDKKFFDVYSSANANHHFKFKPPRKLIFFGLALVALVYLLFRLYTRINGEDAPAQVKPEASSVGSVVGQASEALGAGMRPAAQSVDLTPEAYVKARTPRVSDIPSSAPIYDDLTRAQSYPRLSCMSSTDQAFLSKPGTADRMILGRGPGGQLIGCQCYTQQGSRYPTGLDYCLNVTANGYFDPARPDVAAVTRQQLAPQQTPQQIHPPQAVSTGGTAGFLRTE